jgi:predicted aconitase with swiveling domain
MLRELSLEILGSSYIGCVGAQEKNIFGVSSQGKNKPSKGQVCFLNQASDSSTPKYILAGRGCRTKCAQPIILWR